MVVTASKEVTFGAEDWRGENPGNELTGDKTSRADKENTMFTPILTNRRIYKLFSRRDLYQMLKYIGKNNGNATTGVFDLELLQKNDSKDIQANFTDMTQREIWNANKK